MLHDSGSSMVNFLGFHFFISKTGMCYVHPEGPFKTLLLNDNLWTPCRIEKVDIRTQNNIAYIEELGLFETETLIHILTLLLLI